MGSARTDHGRVCDALQRLLGRAHNLASKYSLTEQDVAELLEQQAGRCAICLTAPAVHVDHDHATGEIRGLLCFPCNAALGQLDDDAHVIRRAADYLEGRVIRVRPTKGGGAELIYPPEPAESASTFSRTLPIVDVAALREHARRYLAGAS